jgi:hypothetical protein
MREARERLLDATAVDSVMYASAEARLANGGGACAAAGRQGAAARLPEPFSRSTLLAASEGEFPSRRGGNGR